MTFAIILLSVILLVAFVAAVCTRGSGLASRQEEYLEECEKQKHKEETNH
jgi:hypothetical protein